MSFLTCPDPLLSPPPKSGEGITPSPSRIPQKSKVYTVHFPILQIPVKLPAGVFTIEPKPPQAVISLPQDGAVIPPGMPVIFSGNAYDREDGMLPGSALAWESDRDGPLGNGEQVLAPLSPGWHTISLTATDSNGNPAVVSIRVFVGTQLYLPVLQRP